MLNAKMTRVLIVDDEAGSRRGLSELVCSWGYETETAADGVEGLAKSDTFRPQVVIADLVMPRMDHEADAPAAEDDAHAPAGGLAAQPRGPLPVVRFGPVRRAAIDAERRETGHGIGRFAVGAAAADSAFPPSGKAPTAGPAPPGAAGAARTDKGVIARPPQSY